jgi:hypothetical protein
MWKRVALGALGLIVVALAVLLLLGSARARARRGCPRRLGAAAPITDVGRGPAKPAHGCALAGEVPTVPAGTSRRPICRIRRLPTGLRCARLGTPAPIRRSSGDRARSGSRPAPVIAARSALR